MKKLLRLMVFSFLFIILTGLFAGATTVEFTVGDVTFNTQNGDEITSVQLDAAPYVNESSRTMVPVRAIAEAFGAEVGWDEPTQTVTIKNSDTEIKLVIGSNSSSVNGLTVSLDTVPVLENGRTFVPLRFISEAFTYNVNYVSSTEQIVIDNTQPVLIYGNAVISLAEFESLYLLLLQLVTSDEENAGIPLSELKDYCLYSALETYMPVIIYRHHFPGAALSSDDIVAITDTLTDLDLYGTLPLNGMAALALESSYKSDGDYVIKHIKATNAPKELYQLKYVCAKHILVKDAETAKLVYDKAVSGEDFDSLLYEYGIDPGMKNNPGGYVFTYGEMVEPFEKASFALDINGISQPVESTFGYHIIKRLPLPDLTEIQETSLATEIVNSNIAISGLAAPSPLFTTEELLQMIEGV